MVAKIQADITSLSADVILCADNTQLKHHGGVALAIAKAAGGSVQLECNDIGFIPINEFVPTSAGHLDAQIILHIPTVDYTNRSTIHYDQLEDVFKRALHFVKSRNFKSVLTPLLGAGIGGLDEKIVEEILEKVGKEYTTLEVTIVRYTE